MPKAKFGIGAAASFAARLIERRQVARPRDFVARKVSHTWLYHLQMELLRVGRGLYVVRGGPPLDPLVLVARKYPNVTLGLTSALWAHGLIDRPARDWWVIGSKDRLPTQTFERARFVRSSWPRDDRVRVELLYEGCFIETQTRLRAVLDCVRFRRQLGERSVEAAMRAVLASEDPEFAGLDTRAAELHIYGPYRRLRRRVLSAPGLAPEREAVPTTPRAAEDAPAPGASKPAQRPPKVTREEADERGEAPTVSHAPPEATREEAAERDEAPPTVSHAPLAATRGEADEVGEAPSTVSHARLAGGVECLGAGRMAFIIAVERAVAALCPGRWAGSMALACVLLSAVLLVECS